jgi:UDP-2,4-diacetamido-2,4,6-trideoxy-beta-L-altropyranose hydrolase
MRCLSLAQGWQQTGGEAVFACAEITPALETRLSSEGFTVHRLSIRPGSAEDAQQTFGLPLQPRWLVADGYHFDAAYQLAIKNAGLRLLVLDDYAHAGHYYADLVLNQNLHASASLYQKREPWTRLLLGAQYVLLRRQFLAYRDWKRDFPETARKILVTLGGADPLNLTAKVLAALRELDADMKLVLGGSNPHYDQLRPLAPPTSILCDVRNMPELMAWADLAVSSGGTTVWELAFMGLPSIIGEMAYAETVLASGLAELGLFQRIGWLPDNPPEQIKSAVTALMGNQSQRMAMGTKGRSVIDGMGCQRVIEAMNGVN